MKIKQLLIKGSELIEFFNIGCYNTEIKVYSQNGYEVYFPEYAKVTGVVKDKYNTKAKEQYKANFQKQVYEHLSYLIVCLDTATVFEKERITNQIKSLSKIFFDDLDSENDTYWQTYETIFESEQYNDFVFKKPKEFTKEYVLNIIQNTPTPAANNEQEACAEKAWFIVGLKFVDGTAYKYNIRGKPRASKVFKDELKNIPKEKEKEKQNKIKLYANYLDYSHKFISDLTEKTDKNSIQSNNKNLFKQEEKHEKRWLEIIKHCKTKPSQSFIDDFFKVYDYDPTK